MCVIVCECASHVALSRKAGRKRVDSRSTAQTIDLCSTKTPRCGGLSGPVLPFSKLNKMFFGYFDPENVFLDNENN